jgi:phage baseplate assembly protein V
MDTVLKNLVRVGRVSSINSANATVRVVFEDRENMVSYDLPVIVRQSMSNKEYWMPDVGEQVLCLFLPNGNAQGFCLGSFYSDEDQPPVDDPNKWHVRFEDGTSIEYDRDSHTLTADVKGAVNIIATEGVTITGNLQVNGSINATGSIIDVGGNTNHHSH